MNSRAVAGVGLFGLGVVGYVAGVYLAYPGRELSLTAIMAGIALAVIETGTGGES